MEAEKQTNSSSNTSEMDSFLLAEYSALREEILKRIELRYQILSFTVIIWGTILGFGLQARSSLIILLYPIMATFLVATWDLNGFDIQEMGKYIKEQIEDKVKKVNIGWEHRIRSRQRFLGGLRFLSARGIFMSTSLLAILIAIPLAHFNLVEMLFFIFASISVVLSFMVLRRSPRQKQKKNSQEALSLFHTDIQQP